MTTTTRRTTPTSDSDCADFDRAGRSFVANMYPRRRYRPRSRSLRYCRGPTFSAVGRANHSFAVTFADRDNSRHSSTVTPIPTTFALLPEPRCPVVPVCRSLAAVCSCSDAVPFVAFNLTLVYALSAIFSIRCFTLISFNV